jgi:hypothetical protein
MTRLGKGLSAALARIAAGGIVVLVVWAFIEGVEADPAVVGPIFTAALGLAVVAYQRTREKRQELERLHRDEMSPIYEQLVEMAKAIDEFVEKPEHEQKAFFRGISTKLLLHGSSPVVRAWVGWLQALGVAPATVPLRAQEQFFRAIRTDLGLDNSALNAGDLLRLYLNEEDTDEDRALWKALRSGS